MLSACQSDTYISLLEKKLEKRELTYKAPWLLNVTRQLLAQAQLQRGRLICTGRKAPAKTTANALSFQHIEIFTWTELFSIDTHPKDLSPSYLKMFLGRKLWFELFPGSLTPQVTRRLISPSAALSPSLFLFSSHPLSKNIFLPSVFSPLECSASQFVF